MDSNADTYIKASSRSKRPYTCRGGREAVDYSVKIGEEHQLFSAPDYFATEAIVSLQGTCPFRIVLALPLIPCGF